jgi:hypothetical protein
MVSPFGLVPIVFGDAAVFLWKNLWIVSAEKG